MTVFQQAAHRYRGQLCAALKTPLKFTLHFVGDEFRTNKQR